MEIDVLPAQIRMGSLSNKRSREPGSPGSVERAAKRPTTIQFESMSALGCANGVTHESGTTRRWSLYDDEWVHQTRGMTIHSPAFQDTDVERASAPASCSSDEQGVDGDMHMHMQSQKDVQMSGLDEALLCSELSLQGFQQKMLGQSALNASEELDASSMRNLMHSSSDFQSLEPVFAPLDLSAQDVPPSLEHVPLETQPRSAPPSITLHPATPSTPSDVPLISYVLSSSRPCTPPPLTGETPSSPMSIIADGFPPSPSSRLKDAMARKRPFVSMGPRADCEKCRMKVPGHWMHFD